MKNKMNKVAKAIVCLFLVGIFILESAVPVNAEDGIENSNVSTSTAFTEETSTVTGSSINTNETVSGSGISENASQDASKIDEENQYWIDLFNDETTYNGKVSVFEELESKNYYPEKYEDAFVYINKYFYNYYMKEYNSLESECNSIKDMRKSYESFKKKVNKFKKKVKSNNNFNQSYSKEICNKCDKLKTQSLKRYKRDAKKYYESLYKKYNKKNYKKLSAKKLGNLIVLMSKLRSTVENDDSYITKSYENSFIKKCDKLRIKYEKQLLALKENKYKKFAAKLAKKLGIKRYFYNYYVSGGKCKFCHIKDLDTGRCYDKNGKELFDFYL